MGHITRDELRRQITDTDMANGLANRYLWICTRRSKCLPEGGGDILALLEPLIERLQSTVEFSRNIGVMCRDERAKEMWAQVYPSLSEGKPGLLGAATSRAEAQVMRLAMLYALLDKSAVIRAEHLMAGLAVWEYADASAKHIFGSAMGDPTADELLRAIRTAGGAGLTRYAIRRHFSGHKPADEINRALSVLIEGGRVDHIKVDTHGRPAERFTARP